MDTSQYAQLLKSNNPSIRMRAAEDLGDIVEQADLADEAIRSTVQALVDAACLEIQPKAREAISNTLAIATARFGDTNADLERFLTVLERFDDQSLEHVLCALGSTKRIDVVPTIEAFRQHRSDFVRQAAEDALIEIEGRQ